MLKDFIILKTIISFIVPYVVLYAIYIQLNGEASPGGGFQAGVIFASSVIAFDLINGKKETRQKFSRRALCVCGVLGVVIYSATGLISFFFDDNYLNYYSIAKIPLINDPLKAQHIGIFSIELGVGLTVASIMCLIYLVLREEE